jgi:glycosyltransferase involved in cell wall biosynthesis
MKKVLIITYYWPPGSGAGVQRWLKFARYLPEFGWEPVILTVDPDYASYPALDNSLENDLPPEVKVYRTRATDWFRFYSRDKSKVPSAGFAKNQNNSLREKTLRFVRGNFFIPDPRRGWNRFAYKKAVEIIEKEKIIHVITTSPPHSTQLIGLKLKKNFPGIKWIADLRDPWTDIYYYKQFYPTVISQTIDKTYQNDVLRSSDKIITVGNSLRDLFISRVGGIKEKIEVITNGFDEEDFKGHVSITPEKFTIAYIGTLSDAYPVNGLLNELEKLKAAGNDFLFRLIGTVSLNQKEKILKAAGSGQVEFISYVNHNEAIKYMMSATVLLLIIPDHHSNKSILTGKLFEYLASGKPVLCLGPPDGDAAAIISETGAGKTYSFNDTASIGKFLNQSFSEVESKPDIIKDKFSRIRLTKRLVDIIR